MRLNITIYIEFTRGYNRRVTLWVWHLPPNNLFVSSLIRHYGFSLLHIVLRSGGMLISYMKLFALHKMNASTHSLIYLKSIFELQVMLPLYVV